MIHIKSDEEIEIIRQNCLSVSEVLALVASVLKPGISGLHIDKLAHDYIKDQGGEPGFLNYQGFPNTLCISVNDCVVHGIPGMFEFNDGDIVSVDCGVKKDGYYGDAAYTFAIGEIGDKVTDLLRTTKESLHKGIEKAVVGKRIGDVAHSIQKYCEDRGYGVVRELVGHGIGKNLHEKPEVPNYGRPGKGPRLRAGMTIAIEPMINLGKKNVHQAADGWTIRTDDGGVSAHYEHSIAITPQGPDILSNHGIVEEAIKKNTALTSV